MPQPLPQAPTALPFSVALTNHSLACASLLPVVVTVQEPLPPAFSPLACCNWLQPVPKSSVQNTWAWPEKFSGQEYTVNKRLQALLNPGKWPKARQGMHDVLTLITQLAPAYNIDPDRIYVVGCGEGGTGVLGAISNPQSAPFFAGGVDINGVWSLNDAAKMAGVPLLMMQGLADKATDAQLPNSITQIIHNVGGNQVYYQEFADLGTCLFRRFAGEFNEREGNYGYLAFKFLTGFL